MPPEISGHSSSSLYTGTQGFCNILQLFSEKNVERGLDELSYLDFSLGITAYQRDFPCLQRNTSSFGDDKAYADSGGRLPSGAKENDGLDAHRFFALVSG